MMMKIVRNIRKIINGKNDIFYVSVSIVYGILECKLLRKSNRDPFFITHRLNISRNK